MIHPRVFHQALGRGHFWERRVSETLKGYYYGNYPWAGTEHGDFQGIFFFSYLAVHFGCLNIPNISNTHSAHKPLRSVNLSQRKSQEKVEEADKADVQDTQFPKNRLVLDVSEQALGDAILCWYSQILWVSHIYICLFLHKMSLHIPGGF